MIVVIVTVSVGVVAVAIVPTPFQLEGIDSKEFHVVVALIVASHSVLYA